MKSKKIAIITTIVTLLFSNVNIANANDQWSKIGSAIGEAVPSIFKTVKNTALGTAIGGVVGRIIEPIFNYFSRLIRNDTCIANMERASNLREDSEYNRRIKRVAVKTIEKSNRGSASSSSNSREASPAPINRNIFHKDSITINTKLKPILHFFYGESFYVDNNQKK